GAGWSFSIKIPLTLAIVSALIVQAGGDRFAIPQLSVVELVRVQSNSEHRIERIRHTPVLRLRNKLLPLARLDELLGIAPATASEPEDGFIVVVQIGNQTCGIVVDVVFLLVFRAGSSELKAVPLSLITRLEQVDCGKIEVSGGRHLFQYRGQLIPVIRLRDEIRIPTEGTQPLLVFSDHGCSMA